MLTKKAAVIGLALTATVFGTQAQARSDRHHHRHYRPLAERTYVPLPPRRGDGGTVFALVTRSAALHGVPAGIAHSVVRIESGYRCHASSGIAHGVMQVQPATARGVGVRGNLFDCATGVEAGMRYLAKQIHTYGLNCSGISAYNTGRGGCTAYGRRVLRTAGL